MSIGIKDTESYHTEMMKELSAELRPVRNLTGALGVLCLLTAFAAFAPLTDGVSGIPMFLAIAFAAIMLLAIIGVLNVLCLIAENSRAVELDVSRIREAFQHERENHVRSASGD